jgi:uncharacterized protein
VLIIDLRRLAQAPLEVRGEIAGEDSLWVGTGLELASPLTAQATAEGSAARGVWVRGTLEARLRATCRRCLEPLELEICEDFDWLFDPKVSEADADLTLYPLDLRAEEIDLRDPLRERLLLAVPAFPVCAERCRGLCGRCGANLDEGDCDCEVMDLDPRWAPLRALRSESRGTTVE